MEHTRDAIVVIGGYGHVGGSICRELGEAYPGRVYAAGRSLEKAEAFSASTGGKVRPLQLDVRQAVEQPLPEDTRLVVMCLDQTDTGFMARCLRQGIRYMDISAETAFLLQAAELNQTAVESGATACLSIGLAPGLTNLLAKDASTMLEHIEHIDIAIMLGLGDEHGQAAMEWTLQHMATDFTLRRSSEAAVRVHSFADGQSFDMGSGLGRRTAYRFNFPDQHTLPGTLSVPSVSTRLCLDPPWATRLIALLRGAGLVRLLKRDRIRRPASKLMGRLRTGSDSFAVKVEARGLLHGQPAMAEALIEGRKEAAITALVAAAAARALYERELPPGVFQLDQLFGRELLAPEVWSSLDYRHGVHLIMK